jgi:hypothetical protein
VDAAVAAAAHDVLVALSPSQAERIEAEYAAALAELPDGPAKEDGVALGRRCAQANLDRRAADEIPVGAWPPAGPVSQPVYVPTGVPGDYDFTPPFDGPPLGPLAVLPGWGRITPFAVDVRRYRLRGPEPLTSPAYARDLNLLKTLGRRDSPTRTDEQTGIARFWFEEHQVWNGIATAVLRRTHADAWRSARLLALLNFAMADGSIACFAEKYRFRFWRPYTAIRRASEDGNPETEPDSEWLPLLWTDPGPTPPTFLIPPVPEYPSAAAVISAAAAEVLIREFGDAMRFEAASWSVPGATRRFRGFTDAAMENGRSRVYGGIHFLHAVEDGYRLGKAIGADVSRVFPRAGGGRRGSSRDG